jgi:transcriptional regulator GlxA family with amidase domain
MTRIVEFFLHPNALSLDISGPLEVFEGASEMLRRRNKAGEGYRAVFSAAQPGAVRLSAGLQVRADKALSAGRAPHTLLIPGGPGIEERVLPVALLNALRQRARSAKRVVSVCGGAFMLAAAGLLDGKRATTHWMAADTFAARYPKVRVEPDAIYVRAGKIATSAGVTAGIDLALALVEEDHGPEIALQTARLLVLYLRRPGSQAQFSAPLQAQSRAGKRFSKLHDWIVSHLQESPPVERLAAQAAMSPRNFARVFTEEVKMTPAKYVECLRADRARELLQFGDTLEQMAYCCGFGKEERLRSVFQRRYGINPRQYRLHFAQHES